MSQVTPPPAPLPLPAVKLTGDALAFTIPAKNIPPTLQLPVDGLLNTLSRPLPDGSSALTLTTPSQNFTLKLPFPLPEGVSVGLKATQNPQTGGMTLHITSLNGQPLPAGIPPKPFPPFLKGLGLSLPPSLQGQSTAIPAGLQTNPATTVSLQNGSGLQARVLPSVTTGAATQTAQGPSGQTGGQGPALPQTTMAMGQQGKAPVIPQNLQGLIQNPTAQGAGQFKPDSLLSVRLLSVQTQGEGKADTSQTASNPAARGLHLSGQVLQSSTQPPQTIVATPMGRLSLSGVSLPPNSQVTLDVVQGNKASDSKPIATEAPLKKLPLQDAWPKLEESLEAIKQLNPNTSETMLNASIPKPDHRLLANMAFFLKTVGRGGQFKDWADDSSLRILSRQKPDLLGEIEKDFGQLSERANPQNQTDWRIFFMPFQHQNQLEQIRIAVRKDRDPDQDTPDEKPDVRIVFDIKLSQLGAMQFDGLTKEPKQQFDLIIRTHKTLPADVRRTIYGIYSNALEVIRYQGKLTYQVTPNFLTVENDVTKPDARALGLLI